jgi:RNA polymerase sigma-70 factor (ECF subfamily)
LAEPVRSADKAIAINSGADSAQSLILKNLRLAAFSTNRLAVASDYPCERYESLPVNRTSREICDELLVIRCKRRDMAAWDELVRRWNDRLLYYLRRLIDDEHDATNALQEVWLHAFRGVHGLKNDSRLAPWLYRIARRTAMNHFRSRYARREEIKSEAVADVVDDNPDTQLHFENAELVHYAFARLGLPEREALTLYFLEDLTVAEMAELLEIPTGTVKSRLFKARQDLRRVLEREDPIHEK